MITTSLFPLEAELIRKEETKKRIRDEKKKEDANLPADTGVEKLPDVRERR